MNGGSEQRTKGRLSVAWRFTGILLLGAACALLVLVVVWGGLGPPLRERELERDPKVVCTWENTRAAVAGPKPPLHNERTLTPAEGSAQRVTNIDGDRDPAFVDAIRLDASRAVPKRVEPDHFEIYADPLVRTGDEALETVDFPEPRFSPPRFIGGRSRIQFTLCLDPAGVPAGKYTGLVNVDGPPGITGTTMAITANAKDSELFWRGTTIALVVALLTLLFKGAADKRLLLRKAPTPTEPDPEWPSWRTAFGKAVGDLQFVFTSVAAVAAAFGALYTVYASDAAWGASGLVSIFSLLVTAFAAVGGQSLLAGLRQGSGTGTNPPAEGNRDDDG